MTKETPAEFKWRIGVINRAWRNNGPDARRKVSVSVPEEIFHCPHLWYTDGIRMRHCEMCGLEIVKEMA